MELVSTQTDVKETLSLKDQLQGWADLHYQNYYLDLTKGPDTRLDGYKRRMEVIPLSESQLAAARVPNNWKTAWPKKWGFCLPRGMKPPTFLRWEDALSFWRHHLNEFGKMKERRKQINSFKNKLEKTPNFVLWRQRPEIYRFKPSSFELPDEEIADYWVSRINFYFFKKMSKHKVLDNKNIVEIRCYSALENQGLVEHSYLKVYLLRYRNPEYQETNGN